MCNRHHELRIAALADIRKTTKRKLTCIRYNQFKPPNRSKVVGLTSAEDMQRPGIILVLGSANERRRYIVTTSLIGWAQYQNDPWEAYLFNYFYFAVQGRSRLCEISFLAIYVRHIYFSWNQVTLSFKRACLQWMNISMTYFTNVCNDSDEQYNSFIFFHGLNIMWIISASSFFIHLLHSLFRFKNPIMMRNFFL